MRRYADVLLIIAVGIFVAAVAYLFGGSDALGYR